MTVLRDTPRETCPIPLWPRAAYVVARSQDIGCGDIVSATIGERDVVVFRTRSGGLEVLPAHCPHMGAHLRQGVVQQDGIRCAVHHRVIRGGCDGLMVHERFGLVFLTPAGLPDLPAPDEADSFIWAAGPWLHYDCDWRAIVVNGFDLAHMRTVHGRELVEPPVLRTLDAGRFEFCYVSRVVATGLSDRVLRILGGTVKARVVCWGGPVVVVESRIGGSRTAAVLAVLPNGVGKTRAVGAFGVERTARFPKTRLHLARWLFTTFLRRDLAPLAGMHLNLAGDRVDDPGVIALTEYLRGVPALDATRPAKTQSLRQTHLVS